MSFQPRSPTVFAAMLLRTPEAVEESGYTHSDTLKLRRSLVPAPALKPNSPEAAALRALMNYDHTQAVGIIDALANINAADELGLTLLHHAAARGMVGVAARLIARGADPNATSIVGERVLAYCINCNAVDDDRPGGALLPRPGYYEVLQLLLRAGADPACPQAITLPPYRPLPGALSYAVAAGDRRAADLLLQAGAPCGQDELLLAAATRHPKMVDYLLFRGVDPRPLEGDAAIRDLVRTGADPRSREGRLTNAILDKLARAEAVAMVRERMNLPVAGADLTEIPNAPLNFCALAEERSACGDYDMARVCLDVLGQMRGFEPVRNGTPLAGMLQAAASGNIPQMAAQMQQGLGINAHDLNGRAALHFAVIHGQVAAARFLLARGADPAQQDVMLMDPFMYAAKAGHNELVLLLLANQLCPVRLLQANWAGLNARQIYQFENMPASYDERTAVADLSGQDARLLNSRVLEVLQSKEALARQADSLPLLRSSAGFRLN